MQFVVKRFVNICIEIGVTESNRYITDNGKNLSRTRI